MSDNLHMVGRFPLTRRRAVNFTNAWAEAPDISIPFSVRCVGFYEDIVDISRIMQAQAVQDFANKFGPLCGLPPSVFTTELSTVIKTVLSGPSDPPGAPWMLHPRPKGVWSGRDVKYGELICDLAARPPHGCSACAGEMDPAVEQAQVAGHIAEQLNGVCPHGIPWGQPCKECQLSAIGLGDGSVKPTRNVAKAQKEWRPDDEPLPW